MIESYIKNVTKNINIKKVEKYIIQIFDFLQESCIKCKNFIRQLEKEYAKNKLKIIKNNKDDKKHRFI